MGKKTLTGKVSISAEEFNDLKELAVFGVEGQDKIKQLSSRISDADNSASYYREKYYETSSALDRLQEKDNSLKNQFDQLSEKCRPFLQALQHFPETSKSFALQIHNLLKSVEKLQDHSYPTRKSSKDREQR